MSKLTITNLKEGDTILVSKKDWITYAIGRDEYLDHILLTEVEEDGSVEVDIEEKNIPVRVRVRRFSMVPFENVVLIKDEPNCLPVIRKGDL